MDTATLKSTSQACIDNAKRLLEDGEWCSNRPSTGLALAMLAQEECAKAFVLILVGDHIIPWSSDLRDSLYDHHCKYVLLLVMEWLAAKHRDREAAWLKSEPQPAIDGPGIPPEVAKAMNVYRHEMLEDQSRNVHPKRFEWRGVARKVASGKSDKRKQNALYIGIGPDGQVTTRPPKSLAEFDKEIVRAKDIIAFVETIHLYVPFGFPEYVKFTGVFGSMFEDLEPDFDRASVEERFPSSIPGVELVRQTITVADVGTEDDDGSSNGLLIATAASLLPGHS